MKILICATRMSIGGAETHVLSLARALRAMGQLVCVASSGGEYVGALREAGIRHLTLPLDKKDPASVMKCRGAIYKIVREGGFDALSYGITSFIDLFRKEKKNKYKTFYDYKEEKASKTLPVSFVLISGLIFMALAIIMLLLYL